MSVTIVPDVISVEPLEDYLLKVAFADGRVSLFDFKPYLAWNCYAHLKNTGFFSLASVAYGTVVWPGDIDIDPALLYASPATA